VHRGFDEDENLREGLRRLRELGYLQSPAEQFVARRVPPAAGSFRVAAVAGLWLGAGGGLLLALLLAISMAVVEPLLLDHPGDLGRLTLDLLLVGMVGGAVLVTLLTWPLVVWRRRRGALPMGGLDRFIDLLGRLLPALYLCDLAGRVLLPHVAGALWYGALAVAALVATLLGDAWGRLLRALVSAAGLRGRDGLSLAGARGPMLALVLAASVLLLVGGPYRRLRPLPRLDQVKAPVAQQNGAKLAVIFVDGVQPQDVPGTLESLDPPPPVEMKGERLSDHPETFWSTVATGFPPAIHGLMSPAAMAPAGVDASLGGVGRQPFLQLVVQGLLPGVGLGVERAHDQRELRRPPFWEIAVHEGRQATVIDAWATYPAARHEGLSVVSDRCFLRMWDGADAGNDPLLVHPLQPRLVVRARKALGERSSHPSLVQGDSLLANVAFRQMETFREVWDYAAASDLFHAFLAREAFHDRETDLVVLQLNGVDLVRRAAARCDGPATAELARRLLGSYLEFQDDLLRGLMEEAAGRQRLLILSRKVAEEGASRRRAWVWPRAFLGEAMSVRAVTPGVLAALGIPAARDMVRPSPQGPASWGLRPAWTPAAGRSPADLERLRSLGYIGSSKERSQ